jgi:molybdopterin-guanine dinucleotide biosynthesis protein A
MTGGDVLLRCCLLSGGQSRRMGVDKALLPHPDGGTWLSHSLALLATLQVPITLCSHHPLHREAIEALPPRGPGPLTLTQEPAPGEGPLNALHHLMGLHPGERLLLCAVDMPWLDGASLQALVAESRSGAADPLIVATDGQRLHPLPGIYPATSDHHGSLAHFLASGRRSMLGWLEGRPLVTVPLDGRALRNCNRPADWAGGRAGRDNRDARTPC